MWASWKMIKGFKLDFTRRWLFIRSKLAIHHSLTLNVSTFFYPWMHPLNLFHHRVKVSNSNSHPSCKEKERKKGKRERERERERNRNRKNNYVWRLLLKPPNRSPAYIAKRKDELISVSHDNLVQCMVNGGERINFTLFGFKLIARA